MNKLELYAEAVRLRIREESNLSNTYSHRDTDREQAEHLFKKLSQALEHLPGMRGDLAEYGAKSRNIGLSAVRIDHMEENVERLGKEEDRARRAWIEEIRNSL